MKTSPSQFEMMVTFMEQKGDLSKPSTSAKGRIDNIEGWAELTSLLNSDPTGETKTTEKWKKVWSDLKNNTKRKAARIHRAASTTGGGPALQSRLSDLEQRVLMLVGVQVATGLVDVVETGVTQESATMQPLTAASPPEDIANTQSPPNQLDNLNNEFEIAAEQWNMPGPSSAPYVAPPISPETLPAASGHTPRRRSMRSPRRIATSRIRVSPRARARPSRSGQMEQVANHFLHSEAEWRNVQIKLQEMQQENEKERQRLTEMQLNIQKDWQQTADKFVNILDKLSFLKIKL